jgi:two-component system, NarL family, invasion response regulator UvrY
MAISGLTTVYLVDDQAVIRASFKSWLEDSNQFAVIGQQGDPRAAIAEIGSRKPDLVLLDLAMPGMTGLEALPLIVDANPRGLVVIVTDSESVTLAQQALDGGARGYLSKAAEPKEMLEALARIVAGERVVSPRIQGWPP